MAQTATSGTLAMGETTLTMKTTGIPMTRTAAPIWLRDANMRRAAAILACLACAVPFFGGCDSEETNPVPDELAPPPKGEGFQIAPPEFEIAAGDEIQNCYFYKVSDLLKQGGLDNGKELNLHHIQIHQSAGSHHMNVFKVKTIVNLDPANGTSLGKNGDGECFKSPNWADWPLIANSQQDGKLDWEFPDGVANKLSPDDTIMVQSHFVNATSQKSPGPGKVAINFWHIPDAEVKYEMGTLFATKQSIRVCASNPTPTFQGSCQIKSDDPVHVIAANGHFHSRGTQFDMYAWDGTSTEVPPESERFYESQKWDEPPMTHSPELVKDLPANGGVFYTCSYEWQQPDPAVGCEGLNAYDKAKHPEITDDQLDCCYTFGPIVEKNEHCNAFVYYYPKKDDIVCQ